MIVKTKGKVFDIPHIDNQHDSLTIIDFFALKFYNTKNSSYKETCFEVILEYALPYLNNVATSFTKNAQLKEDLTAILQSDLWRLLENWSPNVKYMLEHSMNKNKSCRFHYLMLKQFRNKAINEVRKWQKAQPSKRYVDLNQAISIDDLGDCIPQPSLNILDEISEKDFVDKLLSRVNDTKTKTILKLIQNNASIDEIKKSTNGKALRAIKRRQEACRPIVISLLTNSYMGFMKKLLRNIKDETESVIIGRYCAGHGVYEIKTSLNLETDVVNMCIKKHRPKIMNLLLGA